MLGSGWLQKTGCGGAVTFTSAVVPQTVHQRRFLAAAVGAAVTNAFPEDTLQKNYVEYVSRKFSEVSETLCLIDRLLVSPEAGYASSLLQQRQLLVLTEVDAVLAPHFVLLASAMVTKLTQSGADKQRRLVGQRTPSKTLSRGEDDGNGETPGGTVERGKPFGAFVPII
jgi:hypothetical protein